MWIDWEPVMGGGTTDGSFALLPAVSPVFFLPHNWVEAELEREREAKILLHSHYCGSLLAIAVKKKKVAI